MGAGQSPVERSPPAEVSRYSPMVARDGGQLARIPSGVLPQRRRKAAQDSSRATVKQKRCECRNYACAALQRSIGAQRGGDGGNSSSTSCAQLGPLVPLAC